MKKILLGIILFSPTMHSMHPTREMATSTDPSQHTIMLNVVEEALKKHDVESQTTISCCQRWTKKQLTFFTAVAGCGTALITTVTALIIHFTDCSNS